MAIKIQTPLMITKRTKQIIKPAQFSCPIAIAPGITRKKTVARKTIPQIN